MAWMANKEASKQLLCISPTAVCIGGMDLCVEGVHGRFEPIWQGLTVVRAPSATRTLLRSLSPSSSHPALQAQASTQALQPRILIPGTLLLSLFTGKQGDAEMQSRWPVWVLAFCGYDDIEPAISLESYSYYEYRTVTCIRIGSPFCR